MTGTLSLQLEDGFVRLVVEDTGVGFQTSVVQDRGLGLKNMEARARRLGGRFEVVSQPGHGTRVVFAFLRSHRMRRHEPKAIRLLLVDDHEVLRLGLRTLFSEAGGVQVVGEAGTIADAIVEAARLKPEVVLMDVRLPDGSGIEACRTIRAQRPETRVLFLTSFADDDAVLASILAGADGFLLKEVSSDQLLHAVRTVAGGQSILDPAVTQRVMTRMKSLSVPAKEEKSDLLSPQEQRVLALVAEGKTNKEIAASLELSDKTVGHYLENIFQKLQVSRRSQAAALYARRQSQS